MTSQKVQFFQSESSFASQSQLSDSRYHDFTNQLLAQTDNLFLTLQKDLIPNQSHLPTDKLNYLITRARLMNNNTLPQHVSYLNRIGAPRDVQDDLKGCQQQLSKLLEDWQQYQKGTMLYKQFYNLYSNKMELQEGGFSRKKQHHQSRVQQLLQPQRIQISYNSGKNYNSSARVFNNQPISQFSQGKQKQLTQARQQINRINKVLLQQSKAHQLQSTAEKIRFQKRLQYYLKNIQNPSLPPNQQLNQSQRLLQSLQQTQKLQTQLSELQSRLDSFERDNKDLKTQLQHLRRLQVQLGEDNQGNASTQSIDLHQVGTDRRLAKKYKNLQQQNKLLKNQLKTQRERQYKLSTQLSQQQRCQLDKAKSSLVKKSKQLQQLYDTFDKTKIQLLQLQHHHMSDKMHTQNLKKQNSQLKKAINVHPPSLSSSYSSSYDSIPQSHNVLQSKMSIKTTIQAYQGDGLQGYPYYQILSKQFRIRFKRACLKQKQLLYKEKGVEIGVISQFTSPNQLHFKLFVTNFGEDKINKVKGRLMNANNNVIVGDGFQFTTMAQNQQVKVPVTLNIHHYPLGPLILLLQYTRQTKQQVRILLPAHIFKTMTISQSTDKFRQSQRMTIQPQRKIVKDINDLRGYFGGIRLVEGKIRALVSNEHTRTEVLVGVGMMGSRVEMEWEIVRGSREVGEYWVRTLGFLLGK